MAWIEKRYRVVNGKKTKEILYFVVDRVGGKRVSKPAGPIWQTAKNLKRQIENEAHVTAHSISDGTITLKQAVDEYLNYVKNTFEFRTAHSYEWGVNILLAYFTPGKRVSIIGKPDIIKFRTDVMNTHNVNGMIAIIKYIKTFFSHCIKLGYIQGNPASGALRGVKEKKVAVFYTDEQIRHIMDTCLNKDRLKFGQWQVNRQDLCDIIKVAVCTGMREAEVCNLRKSWIRDGVIMVHGKGDKTRPVAILAKLWPTIQPRLEAGRPDLLFPGWNPYRVRQAWKRLLNQARKTMKFDRARFHDLRHTFASNYLTDGGTLADLQITLGHASILTTSRYIHFQQSHLKQKIDNMKAGFMDEVPPQLAVL